MRFASVTLALLASSDALAGGIAPIVMGGFHTEPLYFYSNVTEGGAGLPITDAAAYEQYKVTQAIGNFGSGLELMLGDRDDLVQGVFRLWWMMDTPQGDPAKTGLVDEDALVVDYREGLRHYGMGSVGIQWGVLRAAQDKFKLGISLHVGTGFLTRNRTEFLLAQAGLNTGYQINRTLEVFIDVDYGLRVRKFLMHGVYGTAGLRILFD